jgi:integrase
MTKKKVKLSNILPILIKKHSTFSPSALRSYILSEYNKDFTSQAITMWLTRHPTIEAELKQQVTTEAVSTVEVTPKIFENGSFHELPTIKKWGIEKATLVSAGYHQGNVQAIKRICQGVFYLKDHKTKKYTEMHVPNWTPKTPERLTLEQAQEFIAAVHNAKSGTKQYRIAVRDFFLSRDHITLKTTEVSGFMPRIGHWKHVFVERPVLQQIFDYIKERNYIAYAYIFLMFKTASRATAAATEYLKGKMRMEDGIGVISVTDKGFHRTGRQTFDKIITPDLLGELNKCWTINGDNPFQNLDLDVVRKLCKEAYRLYLTGEALDLGLTEPLHFWRHMFGTHMLRATADPTTGIWNYTAVAELGNWSNENMLKKVYGAPTKEMLRKVGLGSIPKI